MFDEYKTKVEIRGFATNGSLIIEDRNGIIFKRKPKHVSPLKKKDELEVGDKFKDTLDDINEILFVCADEHYGTVAYTCKRECGLITVNRPIEVAEIIYD